MKTRKTFALLFIFQMATFFSIEMTLAKEYTIENRLTGKVLEIEPDCAGREFTLVRQMTSVGQAAQKWIITAIDEEANYYKIENRASGMVMAAIDAENGSPIEQVRDQGETHQMWILVPANDDYFYLENRRNGKRLEIAPDRADRNGTPVRQMDPTAETAQQWKVVAVE